MKEKFYLKQLEMIQAIINRLANNSFLIKGWFITVVTAGLGLYFQFKTFDLLYLVLFVIFMFWYLDAFYLREERIFRAIYEDKALMKNVGKNSKNIDLRINRKKYANHVDNIFKTMTFSDCLLEYVIAILIVEGIVINYLIRR